MKNNEWIGLYTLVTTVCSWYCLVLVRLKEYVHSNKSMSLGFCKGKRYSTICSYLTGTK